MSDATGSGRLLLIRRLLKEKLSAGPSVETDLSEEFLDLLEQLDAEYEELLRGQRETERYHRSFADLYEYAPVGYLVLNSERIIVQINETARRFLGPGTVDLGRSALGPNISHDTQENYYSALRKCRATGEPASVEFRIERSDGRVYWLAARITCETREGEGGGYRIILSDISDRVLAQRKAETLLEEKELLLREIHHRVKNDFGMVSSLLSLQAADTDIPELKNGMEEARSRVQIMAQIYDTLHRQEQYAEVDLKPFLEHVISGFGAAGGNAGIVTTAEIEHLTAQSSVGVTLGLVLNELLTNVTKYAAAESRDLTVALSLRGREGGEIELCVADNGPGFPQTAISGESLGFGLTIVQALAEQHDGSMRLENANGAVITVVIQSPEIIA